MHASRPEALAERWLISPRTLEQWRWQGRGPRYLKIGGRVVYRLSDIEAFESARVHANTIGPIDQDDRRGSRRCQQLKPSPRPSAGERRAAAGWRAARRMTIANEPVDPRCRRRQGPDPFVTPAASRACGRCSPVARAVGRQEPSSVHAPWRKSVRVPRRRLLASSALGTPLEPLAADEGDDALN